MNVIEQSSEGCLIKALVKHLLHIRYEYIHVIPQGYYYLHEDGNSNILVHGIHPVLEEQWIWVIHDVLFHMTRKVSKRSSAVWETDPACERTVSRTCTLADGSPI